MKCFRYKLKSNPDGSSSGPAAVLPKGSVTGHYRVDADGAWYYGCAHIDSVAPFSAYQMEEVSREVFDLKTLPSVVSGTVVITAGNRYELVGYKVLLPNGISETLTEANINAYIGATVTVQESANRVSLRSLLPKRWILKKTLLDRLEAAGLDDAAFELLELPNNKKAKRRFDSAILIDSEDDLVRTMLNALPGCNVEQMLVYDREVEVLNLSK